MGFNVEINANMPVSYVLDNGTKEHKAVIKMFDYDSNGVIDKQEAIAYNSYSILLPTKGDHSNTIHMLNRDRKEVHVFKYNQLSELDNFEIWNGGLFLRDKQQLIKGESTSYNSETQTITVRNKDEVKEIKLDTQG